MMVKRTDVAVAIIAGGKAVRMGGVEKGSLSIEGRPILERQLDLLTPMFSRVIFVSRTPGAFAAMGFASVSDRISEGGPMAGVEAALSALRPAENAVVCVGCDMPDLQEAMMTFLRDAHPAADLLIPRLDNRFEPLCARYGRALLPRLMRNLDDGARSGQAIIKDWLNDSPAASSDPSGRFVIAEEATLRAVDPQLLSFANVNTPEDLAARTTRVLG